MANLSCAWALALVSAVAACAAEPPAAERCPRGTGSPSLMVELFFGRSMPGGGEVSAQDWIRFVDQVVAPALPDGFTVLDASGAWLSPQGHATRHEPTKLLLVSLPVSPHALAPVQQIRSAYQQRFHQQLVGMSVTPGCGAF